jgi:glycosyltransferase involved in cell wall biosynthesis
MGTRISAVINTLNEEKNLPYALRSVCTWVDEMVVVDMHSSDRTVQIAERFGARVYLHEGPGFNYAPREFSVSRASGEWIFILDADEVAPVRLAKALKEIAERDDVDVVLLPRRNYLLGKALSYTGWGPTQDWQIRFFRRGKVRATSIAHQDFVPILDAKIQKLPFDGENAIVHFSYVNTSDFIERLNRYTTIEAMQASERGEYASHLRALLKGGREFVFRYFQSRGFRDGWRGFYLSLFMAFYRFAMCAKLEELHKMGNTEAVESIYSNEAEKLLGGYKEENCGNQKGMKFT